MTLLPVTANFVRGYNTSGIQVQFSLLNLDYAVEIAYLSNNSRQNFAVGTFLTGANTSVVNVGVNNYTSLSDVISSPSPQQGLATQASLTFSVSFPNNILVPCQPCSQRTWLCVYVTPGTGASFSIVGDVIKCINIASLVNCQGM